jgi:crotonobetainyl-CoA:carnitine CoA-transferase CaiB-like acyl-CoA transferase
MPSPLSGCRVIEIGASASAVAGRILADLGAEVIKVEPEGGESSRRHRPTLELADGDSLSANWLAFNVSKRSIAIDLQNPRGRSEFLALASTADIVITDFQRMDADRSDALAREALAASPSLIWTEISPYGRGHPFEGLPAGDLVLQAMGGHLYLNGDIDRPPVRIGLPVALSQGGAEAASAALMAYYHRLNSGEGQRVDVSIQECVTWTLLNTTMTAQLLGVDEVRGGAIRKERANKYYTRLVWECVDGFIHFAPVGGGGGAAREKSYAALLAWMAEDGIVDPLLTSRDWNGLDAQAIGQADYDAIAQLIEHFIATKTIDELIDRAVRDRILLAPVSSVAQVMTNPQLKARGVFETLHDPGRGTDFSYPFHWARMSATPLSPLQPAPAVDQDGEALRAELYDATGEIR